MAKKTVSAKEGTKLSDIDTDEPAESNDLKVLTSILNIQKTNPAEYNTVKFVLYATCVFMLLALPFTDRVLELAFPMAQNWMVLVGLKTMIFFMVYYILFYLNKA